MGDQHYSELAEHSALARGHHDKKQEIPVIEPRRLRDREALKRKREEAQAKDTLQQDFRSKHQKKAKETGRGRRKQVKEPEPEPQHEPKLEPKHDPQLQLEHELEQEPEHEPEHEQKSALMTDVPLVQDQQAPLEHQIPLPTVSADESAIVIHGEAAGQLPEESTCFLKDEEEVAEAESVPATAAPEVLSFSLSPEEEEHQYYTPLL
ncbi:pinin-like isoform X2 [Pseudophryne corroboree]|uniref:pinin-like isoform X2 n=1 Tax=Pseudophryne corroboree TaxID=495146 RepID=UPI003081E274